MTTGLSRAAATGTAYFGVVFALGFLLGTARVLLLAPRMGEANATFVELPLMLALSWLVCRWLVDRFAVPRRWPARVMMGTVAFGLLMLGELSVSLLGFGRTLTQHLTNYLNPLPALGLAAQIPFGLFPLLQGRRQQSGPSR